MTDFDDHKVPIELHEEREKRNKVMVNEIRDIDLSNRNISINHDIVEESSYCNDLQTPIDLCKERQIRSRDGIMNAKKVDLSLQKRFTRKIPIEQVTREQIITFFQLIINDSLDERINIYEYNEYCPCFVYNILQKAIKLKEDDPYMSLNFDILGECLYARLVTAIKARKHNIAYQCLLMYYNKDMFKL